MNAPQFDRDPFTWPEFIRNWGDSDRGVLSSHWTMVNGLPMHSRGTNRRSAPHFLLIHGMVISSLYMVPLAERLAEMGFEVHAPDLPGYGRSIKPTAPPDVPGMADSLVEWVKAHGGGAWNVVGNSLGCQVAADLAVRFSESVASLTLIGMTVDPAAPTLLQQFVRLVRDLPREPVRLWFDHVVDYVRAGPRFVIGAIRNMMADRIETKLPRIEAPTLIMRGEHDHVTPRTWTDAAMGMLRRGSFVEVPDGTHAVHYSAPQVVAELIRDFEGRCRRS